MVDRLFPAPHSDATDDDLLEWYADRPARAGVVFNFISSVDGSATVRGHSGGLSDPMDQRILRLLRRLADVLVVGAGTIRVEGYAGELLDEPGLTWRAAHGKPPNPPVAVVSGTLRLDPQAHFFTTAPSPPLVYTTERADPRKRAQLREVAEVVIAGVDTVDPRRVVDDLTERGHQRIHSEGGPKLFGSFQEAGVVDSLCLTLSPTLVGGLGARVTAWADEHAMPLELVHVLRSGSMLFLRYRVLRGNQS
ncbi:MAG: dihydrofolate reductase family protein [Actinomycetota bacterium]|nr:dihydrofolate reductase family protein [Actinomycetota bacterium]